MATIDEQITANMQKIESYQSQINAKSVEANSILADGKDDNCGGFGWSKDRTSRCEAEKNRKINNANVIYGEVVTLKGLIANVESENISLRNQRDTETTNSTILAQKGETTASVQVKAEALANATRIQAEAKADVIVKEGETANNNKTIFTIVGVVVALVVVFLIIKKIKNKK